MKALSFIPDSTMGSFASEDAYWVEADPAEFAECIYPLLNQKAKEQFDNSNGHYISDITNEVTTKGHYYFLINPDWSKVKVEKWFLPHAGMWNARNPFRQITPFTFSTQREFQQKIYIAPGNTNVVWFSDIITHKFPDDFARIRTILDHYGIEYRFLKGTRDIWCRDYMPVQISEEDFVQFRYEPSYLKTVDELLTRSDPRLVNPENGFAPRWSGINLDGGNVVRYKEKVMISARVFRENQNLGLTKDQLREKLSHELRAHVIIIPEHPGDLIDHADGNVRFLDKSTVLINELGREYKYWRAGMAKIKEDYGFDFIEAPWFTPKYKRDSLSAIGIYINFLEVGNLIILPKFETEGNRDQEAFELFKNHFPNRSIEQVNINAIAEEGGLLNCISWSIRTANY